MEKDIQNPVQCVVAQEEAIRLLDMYAREMCMVLEITRRQDVDGIHDLRVASRRMRGALKETSLVFGNKERRRFAERVTTITRLLGKARELDVSIGLLKRIRPQLRGEIRRAATFTLHYMIRQRNTAKPQVLAACALTDAPDFERMHVKLTESLHPADKCLLVYARNSIGKLHRRVYKRYARWEKQPTAERLHDVRLSFKKLRYACECHENLFGKPMTTFIKRLKGAQESLGQWNDLRVLRDYSGEAAQDSALFADAAPQEPAFQELQAALERRMTRMLDAFHRSAGSFFRSDIERKHAKLFSSPRAHCLDCPLFQPVEASDSGVESGGSIVNPKICEKCPQEEAISPDNQKSTQEN